MELTHASFFSGVGGLDLGLERAGWRTVSFSEIDPYASAVLAERWPGVPNLGDIIAVRRVQPDRVGASGGEPTGQRDSYATAVLWSGGFPCQDLSVAGKRAGFAGERSSLAFSFLDLVERHRPPAILLENVPGLLSSHGGRDFGALLGAMGQLGYWWAYRILDARHFGVPQRRRRVFIVGLHAERGFGADSAAAVLSVGTRCGRHPATGHQTGEGAAERTGDGTYLPQSINAKWATGYSGPAGDEHHNLTLAYAVKTTDGKQSGSPERSDRTLVLSPPLDAGGVRAPDGLAGGLDDRTVVNALDQRRGGVDDNEAQAGQLVHTTGRGWWTEGFGTIRADAGGMEQSGHLYLGADLRRGRAERPDPVVDGLLPLGLDSHRYRCCGNGVVSNVSEWIGVRLAEEVA